MAINIEVKAHVRDMAALRQRVERMSDTPCQVIPQEDTFFNCPIGRLKLRRLSPQRGQLVYYQRRDISGPKRSDYQIFETADPAGLKRILVDAYGVRGVVIKNRSLYLVGQTRIHLDQVHNLGDFMELEVVLKPGQSDAEGEKIARRLMEKLGIEADDLIDTAYIDLFDK
jgi:predicted adenylyl cyclase CyaB